MELNYKDTNNKDRIWSITVEGPDKNNVCHIVTTTGQVGGKMRKTYRKVKSGKNKGKINETTVYEQAWKEAQSRYNEKKQEIECKQQYGVMLANKFVDKKKTINYPVYVQPKLDGCRGLVFWDKDQRKIRIISRNGLDKVNPLTHIKRELEDVVIDFNGYLDGELYCHTMLRQKIVGLCNKKEELKRTLNIEFHIFDCVLFDNRQMNFSERYKHLQTLLMTSQKLKYIKLVPTEIATIEQDIYNYHDKYVSMGYEGLIVRKDAPYQGKRTSDLLKYKHFEDAEFEICGYHEGQGDWEGTPIWECWFDKQQGLKFSAKQRGTIEELKKLFKHADKYIGKLLTVRYQSKLENGCPEFGVGVELDRRDL